MPLNYKHIKRPEFFTPVSMHFSDTSNGFILNSNGLLQWKENLWQPVNTGDASEFTYTNIFTVNSQNTFLCSYDGKVSLFNGDTLMLLFQMEQSETINPMLNTIFMIDSSSGWAAGEGGTLLKINGSAYSIENFSSMYSFREIYFDRPDHGWMIGYVQEHIEDGGVVFEYNGDQWTEHSTINSQVYDIEFSSPGHGFITAQNDIYRYNTFTDEWQPENIPDYYQQYHLSMLNDDYGISVSDNSRNMLYENGEWSQAPAAEVSDLVNIVTTGNGNAWAISQIGSNNPADLNGGKIQKLQENAWNEYSLQYLDTTFILPMDLAVTNINGIDRHNTWFNGQYVNIPGYNVWPDSTPVLNSDTFCLALKLFSTNFGLGLNGDLLEWNGYCWINRNIDPFLHPDTSVSNLCMQVFNDTTGFICRQLFSWSSGEIKNVIASYDYTTNSLTTSQVLETKSPIAIHFSGKQNGWCVGDSGLTVKYYDNHWETLPTVTDKRLTAVFTIDSSNAWAIGDDGVLLKYDGTAWMLQSLPVQNNLYSIYFTDSTHGWIVGDSGLILRYNGTEWISDTSGTSATLYSVFMIDSTFGFAAGDSGIVLQFSKPVPPVQITQQFCEGGNTFYVYHPEGTGYAYQWQIDAGSGFGNLLEDDLFSGVTSDTLWLTGMPAALYGYQFRCIATLEGVDSISNIDTLKFVNQWTGAVNKSWEEPGNWSCGSLPGENTDVVLNSGEIVLSSEVSIRSLKVAPGVSMMISEGAVLNILK